MTLYRGIDERSKRSGARWWTDDESYAQQYGDRIIIREIDDSDILDLRELLCDADRDGTLTISASMLEDVCTGLATALGLDRDDAVVFDVLWDNPLNDSYRTLARFLRSHGYSGLAWVEEEHDAYLLTK